MATEYEFIMVLDDGETYSSLKGCKVLMVPKGRLGERRRKAPALEGIRIRQGGRVLKPIHAHRQAHRYDSQPPVREHRYPPA